MEEGECIFIFHINLFHGGTNFKVGAGGVMILIFLLLFNFFFKLNDARMTFIYLWICRSMYCMYS